MVKAVRRGVLLTASGRKTGSWKESAGDDAVKEDTPQASQLEWAELSREVAEERRKMRAAEAAATGRRANIIEYDDLAGAEEDEADEPAGNKKQDDASAGTDGEREDDSPAGEAEVVDDPYLPPEGVTTAGEAGKQKKRGGLKKGSEKRKARQDDDDDDGPVTKKPKKIEDPDRWIKLRLEGEEKPKRIDSTRIVNYYDFDGSVKVETDGAARLSGGVPGGSNFRSQVRRDLFADDSDDE